jgi:hypothetical protein
MVSMQLFLPVRRYAVGRSGHGLMERVVMRRDQVGAIHVIVCGIVVEPVLTRLEAVDHAVASACRMVPGVLGGRGVATPDVAAPRATAEVEPPTTGSVAVLASIAAWRDRRIDRWVVCQSLIHRR